MLSGLGNLVVDCPIQSTSSSSVFTSNEPNVTEATLFQQQDRLVATIKFLYTGIYKKQKEKKADCKLKETNYK